jgi:hypothetical protein
MIVLWNKEYVVVAVTKRCLFSVRFSQYMSLYIRYYSHANTTIDELENFSKDNKTA